MPPIRTTSNGTPDVKIDKAKVRWYGVQRGTEGPKVYETWEECKACTERVPGSVFKCFLTKSQAEAWVSRSPVSAPIIPGSPKREPVQRRENRAEHSKQTRSPESGPSSKPASKSPKAGDPAALVVTPTLKLSAEQETVLKLVIGGRSVFFTGSAGTGKSVLLREIIKDREKMHGRHTLGVTASTGIASVNIGGCTIHSWAGIGIGLEPAKKIAAKILGQKGPAMKRWQAAKTLILDEISMISGDLFDKLEEIARIVRFSDAPFGAIQLVLSGDFCQLPPVPERPDAKGKQKPVVFAFDAKSWAKCVGPPVELVKVFRQKEQSFVDMLNHMRMGKMTPQMITAFQGLSRQVKYTEGPEPTELFAKRNEVAAANAARLKNLTGASEKYVSLDTPGIDARGQIISIDSMQKLLERLIAPEQLTLKIGAQVMLIKNLVQGHLVNGSVGIVISFSTPKEALQMHMDIATAVDPKAGKDPADTRKAELRPELLERKYPVVKFSNGTEMLIVPTDFEVNNADGALEASRVQVPLILAWALSMHKSQGMSIERLKVNMGSIFEKGQAYVALSRATSMDTLQVINFSPTRVMAHERVLEWTETFHPNFAPQDEDEDFIMVDSD